MKKSTKVQPPITPPSEGWYVPDPRFKGEYGPRWVLATGNGHVIYSVGAKRTKECTLQQFDTWRRTYGAQLTRKEVA